MLPRLPEQVRYVLATLVLVALSVFALSPVYPLPGSIEAARWADPLEAVDVQGAGRLRLGARPWSGPAPALPADAAENTLQLGIRG